MDAATVALLVIVGVIVTAIALHLVAIAFMLQKITTTLTAVRGGARAIKGQTDPVGEVITGLAGDVAAMDDDLEGLLFLFGEAQAVQDAEEAAAALAPPPASRPVASSRRAAPAAGAVLLEEAEADDDAADAPYRPTMQEAVARARTASVN